MSLGLSQSDLDAMRADVAELLPDTCVIKSDIGTSDGAGGWTPNWQPVSGGTVTCRVDPMRKSKRIEVEAERESIVNMYTVTLPYNAPVDVDQRIEVNGMTLEVREFHSKVSWRVETQVLAAEIK
jgi:SPP1 family predicted phage head-tail adaptor